MATGLAPSQTIVYPLNGLAGEHFLILAIEAAAKLNWQLRYLSHTGIIAVSSPWPAEVSLKIDGASVSITSISLNNLVVDWGKNKRNIRLFLHTIEELRTAIPAEYLVFSNES